MSGLAGNNDLDILSTEEEVNERRGYKSIIDTPKVSKNAKHNALNLLHDELGGDPPRHRHDDSSANKRKDMGVQTDDLERSQEDIPKRPNDFIEQRDQYPG